MKFIADTMVSKLGKYLLMMGEDVVLVPSSWKDDRIISLARRENRMVLTKDQELAGTLKTQALLLKARSLKQTLQTVMTTFKLVYNPEMLFSRCLTCNTPINPIEKKTVRDRVPVQTYQHFTHFFECPHCKQIFWKGSHFEDVKGKFEGLLEGL